MELSHTITRTSWHTRRESETPYLFLALQCDRPLEAGARFSLDGVDTVVLGRAEALTAERHVEGSATVMRIGVPDPRVSSTHATLVWALGSWMARDLGSKNGTLVDGRRIEREPLRDGALLELGHSFFVFRESLPAKAPAVLDGRDLRPPAPGLATLLPDFADEMDRLDVVARSRIPILVQGETGTGKEVVACAIHQLSGRPGPFVAVNCGALPANLVESELFGYRKGAFSGADEDRPGLVRASDGGTLLLDEIGDLPPASQAALLRVLQEEKVVAIGATRPVKVDLRVVSATHRDLEALVAKNAFRADLLARLSGFAVRLPTLRERREDLGLLVAVLLRKHAGEAARRLTLTADAGRALLLHRWPLNVRELEKSLCGAVVLARQGRIELDHLPAALRSTAQDAPAAASSPAVEPPSLNEEDLRRREELDGKLRENEGNLAAVARDMGKARTQVQRWVKRYRLDLQSYRR